MTFKKWFVTFIEEKGIDLEEGFVVTGPVFGENHMTYQNIYDLILQAPVGEQKAIQKMLVKIDFMNGDVKHYFRHLAKAVAL